MCSTGSLGGERTRFYRWGWGRMFVERVGPGIDVLHGEDGNDIGQRQATGWRMRWVDGGPGERHDPEGSDGYGVEYVGEFRGAPILRPLGSQE